MKTNLFDKKGIEIQIGDRYIADNDKEYVYTVFYKGGAICGGLNEKDSVPLCWDYDENAEDNIALNNDLSWLEIIINPLEESDFIELSKDFLRYSLFGYQLPHPYEDLTNYEKSICNERQYLQLIKFIE